MSPSRELDALIEESVFGRKAVLEFPDQCPDCGGQVPDSYASFVSHEDRPGLDGASGRFCIVCRKRIVLTPNYSSDIKAAMDVVEKVTRKNGEILGAFVLSRWSLYHAQFSFARTGGGRFDFEGVYYSAPGAICIAIAKIIAK